MPWKECSTMDERLKFIARLFEGEKMSPLVCIRPPPPNAIAFPGLVSAYR